MVKGREWRGVTETLCSHINSDTRKIAPGEPEWKGVWPETAPQTNSGHGPCPASSIPQEWAQPTGTCEHPKTVVLGGEEVGWIHRSPGALGLGPCGNLHPHPTHTHSVFPASCLPQPRDPGNLRHIPIDLKNKRKSYTSIFHSLKKCFKKLCTGGGGWEPCPGSDGRRAAVSQPAPWFRPWSCCLLIFMF